MKKISTFLIAVFVLTIAVSCKSKVLVADITPQYFTDSIYSTSLSEYRKHNVYLPLNFNKRKKYPIIYVTDGNAISSDDLLKNTLDSLIGNKIIKPVVLIESFSNHKIADSSGTFGDGKKVYLQYRNFEYINNYQNVTPNPLLENRFKNHMTYFKDELISSVEGKLTGKIKRKDRYFYGYSNGAGFGLSLLNTHPDLIGTYLCFSAFGGDVQTNNWNKDVHYASLYLKFGKNEPPFLKEDADFLQAKYADLNAFIDIEEFDGGHDWKKWNKGFIETVLKLFAEKK